MPRPLCASPRVVLCSIRLTPEEAQRLKSAARAAGLSQSGYLRALLGNGLHGSKRRTGRPAGRRTAPSEAIALLHGPLDGARRLALELARQGNNLNQIAHRLNAFQTVDSAHLRRLIEKTRADLVQPLIGDIRSSLNRLAGIEAP